MSPKLIVTATFLASMFALAVPVIQACRMHTTATDRWSDASITSAVESMLTADAQVAARVVEVNTEEGVVYLIGRVSNAAQKVAAERIARSCEGVHDVVNYLFVDDAG